MTETVLLDIASEAAGHIKVYPFNKHQEGKVGADWEWVFFDQAQTTFVRWLVQAKVLDNVDKQYAHIDRLIGNTNVRQIDRLLQTATSRNIPAVFAFYNHLSNEARLPANPCTCACNECWGFSIARAENVKALLPDKTFDALKAISLPLVCMVCPTPEQGSQTISPIKAARFLQALEVRSSFDLATPQPESIDRFISREPPRYLRQLIDMGDGLSSPSQLERISAQNPGIDGVVLISGSD